MSISNCHLFFITWAESQDSIPGASYNDCTRTLWETLHYHNGVWNHRQLNCSFNSFFRHTTRETSKLCLTGPLGEESTGEFPDKRPGVLCNIGYPSETYLKLKCREILFDHNIRFNCPIGLKFCTEHGSDTAVLCAKFQSDQSTEAWVRKCFHVMISQWYKARQLYMARMMVNPS